MAGSMRGLVLLGLEVQYRLIETSSDEKLKEDRE